VKYDFNKNSISNNVKIILIERFNFLVYAFEFHNFKSYYFDALFYISDFFVQKLQGEAEKPPNFKVLLWEHCCT